MDVSSFLRQSLNDPQADVRDGQWNAIAIPNQ